MLQNLAVPGQRVLDVPWLPGKDEKLFSKSFLNMTVLWSVTNLKMMINTRRVY